MLDRWRGERWLLLVETQVVLVYEVEMEPLIECRGEGFQLCTLTLAVNADQRKPETVETVTVTGSPAVLEDRRDIGAGVSEALEWDNGYQELPSHQHLQAAFDMMCVVERR